MVTASQVETWLKSKITSIRCPVCQNTNNFTVVDELQMAPALDEKTGSLKTNGIPAVVLCCNLCGYMMYFSAMFMGIMKNKNLLSET